MKILRPGLVGVTVILPLLMDGEMPVSVRISIEGTNTVVISWDVIPGTSYVLKSTASLDEPWEVVATNPSPLVAISNTLWYTDSITGNARFFCVSKLNEDMVDLVHIPAGAFLMGDTFEVVYLDERPAHTVQVSEFWMGKHEVTKALWDEVRTWANRYGYSIEYPGEGKATNHPVTQVGWYDAVKWCNARSEKEGLVPCYYTTSSKTSVYRTNRVDMRNDWVLWEANGYRLPTEAEWEHAARGGIGEYRFPWGDTISHSQANYGSSDNWSYDVSSTRGTHPEYTVGLPPYTSPVGSFTTNGYGLYDMVGNLSEWCWDFYAESYYSNCPSSDPTGPVWASRRVVRGGSWNESAEQARCANRTGILLGNVRNTIGFRLVRRPP